MLLRTCRYGHVPLALLALACGPLPPPTTDEPPSTGEPASTGGPVTVTGPGVPSTTSDGVTTTLDTTVATTSPTTAEDSVGATTDGGATFILPSDCGVAVAGELAPRCGQVSCDPWTQDCRKGEKCVPYSGDGDAAWESVKCVPIFDDPGQPGEPCEVEGSVVSGLDSCDIGGMCWHVDPETLQGTCVATCEGPREAPMCDDPTTTCIRTHEGVVNLCLPPCDPLAPACAADQVCAPVDDTFTCVVDASGAEGQVFDPCTFANECDPGLFCAGAAFASECDPARDGCCLPFCDLDLPPDCPGAMQTCVPWYEMGQAPPGLEDIGACLLPP